ncbi:MAG: hypothetical protein CMF12_08800 [Idiomarina sp.]|uniref:hypothetical protein n=1 Tax=Idiomarina sp. TaxID=1874361 RepID=UPI000C44753A|nr:hypothetical protein [Idiomarina sp.]MBT42609.1 hypothetical protein [Idiomarina sp.]|tara:strand:+ start:1475 stop:1888 length:414 start_codon:yes stop_codon:yes gene_type:complete
MDLAHATDHVETLEDCFLKAPILSSQMPLKFLSGVVMYAPKFACEHCGERIDSINVRGHVVEHQKHKLYSVNSVLKCAACSHHGSDSFQAEDRWYGVQVSARHLKSGKIKPFQKIKLPLSKSLPRLFASALKGKGSQ